MSDAMSGVLIDAEKLAKDWNAAASTIRKYSAAAENTGYRFKRGGPRKNKLLFSPKEVESFKQALKMKEEKGNEGLRIEDAIAIVFTAMLDDVADTEDHTSYVTDIVSATSDDIAAITGSIADLTKVISDMSSKMERLEAQNSELANQNQALLEIVNRIESNSSKNDEAIAAIQGTTKMINDMAAEFAASKGKKGFFKRLFGK